MPITQQSFAWIRAAAVLAKRGIGSLDLFYKTYETLAEDDGQGPRAKEGWGWTFQDAFAEAEQSFLSRLNLEELRGEESRLFKDAIPKLIEGWLALAGARILLYLANGRDDDFGLLATPSDESNGPQMADLDAIYLPVRGYVIRTLDTSTLASPPQLQYIAGAQILPPRPATALGIDLINDAASYYAKFERSYAGAGALDTESLALAMANFLLAYITLNSVDPRDPDTEAANANYQILRSYIIAALDTAVFDTPPLWSLYEERESMAGVLAALISQRRGGIFQLNPRATKRARLDDLRRSMTRRMGR